MHFVACSPAASSVHGYCAGLRDVEIARTCSNLLEPGRRPVRSQIPLLSWSQTGSKLVAEGPKLVADLLARARAGKLTIGIDNDKLKLRLHDTTSLTTGLYAGHNRSSNRLLNDNRFDNRFASRLYCAHKHSTGFSTGCMNSTCLIHATRHPACCSTGLTIG